MAEHVAENLSLRVNGRDYNRIKLQYEIKNGFPTVSPEIVIEDSLLGAMRITDECIIEMKDQQEGDWKRVTLLYLVTLMETYRS